MNVVENCPGGAVLTEEAEWVWAIAADCAWVMNESTLARTADSCPYPQRSSRPRMDT